MMSFGFVVALATLPLAFAQSSGNGTSPAAYTIAVGQNGLVFTPEITNAKVGDHVTFQFFPKNHSVVQADFSNPCNPSEGRSGFYSGFFPTSDGPAKKPFTIRVKDEKPMWIYCGALDSPRPHCAAGMVAVINPPLAGPNTLDAFRKLAAATNDSTVPDAPRGGIPNDPSGNSTGTDTPVRPTGAASSLAISGGVVALFALFAGLLMVVILRSTLAAKDWNSRTVVTEPVDGLVA